jgi:hypothetical protein
MKLQGSLSTGFIPINRQGGGRPASIFGAVTLPRLDTGFRRYDKKFFSNPAGISPCNLFSQEVRTSK